MEKAVIFACLALTLRYLSGTISRHIATEYLNAYLKQSRLKPYIVLDEDEHFTQPDRIMTLSLKGNGCAVLIENVETGKREMYTQMSSAVDHNTKIYTTLKEALEQEWQKGARTVKIRTNLAYVYSQLCGENDVHSSPQAFLDMWLTLLSYKYKIEKI